METSRDRDQKSGIFFFFFFFSRGSTVPFLVAVCSLHWMSPWICHLTCFFVILSCRQQMRRHRQSLWRMMMMVVALFRCVPQIDIRYIHTYMYIVIQKTTTEELSCCVFLCWALQRFPTRSSQFVAVPCCTCIQAGGPLMSIIILSYKKRIILFGSSSKSRRSQVTDATDEKSKGTQTLRYCCGNDMTPSQPASQISGGGGIGGGPGEEQETKL